MPTAIRSDVRWTTGGISEIYPPDYPAHLTGYFRATAGRCPAHCPEKTVTHPR